MNELIFIILVHIGTQEGFVDFRSPKLLFQDIKSCDEKRVELFTDKADILERSRCVAVFPNIKAEDVKEAPKEPEKVSKCVYVLRVMGMLLVSLV